MNTPKLELAAKLKALIDHTNTPSGERVTALIQLEKIMEKYNITLEQLTSSEKVVCRFTYHTKYDREILFQVMFKVLNANKINYTKERGKGKKHIYMKITKNQEVQIDMQYKIYRKAFKKEIDLLMNAFVSKHHIYPDIENDNESCENNYSQEELDSILGMMQNLQNVIIPRDQLGE